MHLHAQVCICMHLHKVLFVFNPNNYPYNRQKQTDAEKPGAEMRE